MWGGFAKKLKPEHEWQQKPKYNISNSRVAKVTETYYDEKMATQELHFSQCSTGNCIQP